MVIIFEHNLILLDNIVQKCVLCGGWPKVPITWPELTQIRNFSRCYPELPHSYLALGFNAGKREICGEICVIEFEILIFRSLTISIYMDC